jgi:hypothetical protein
MDVSGRKPTGEKGEYFRNSIWWWMPLAAYCSAVVAPDICAPCKYWHSNDGDGLDAEHASALAEALQREVDEGRTQIYAAERQAYLDQLPDEPCKVCNGTGVRSSDIGMDVADAVLASLFSGGPKRISADPLSTKCIQCNGSGHTRPLKASYQFSADNVVNFASFLRESGGFVIF